MNSSRSRVRAATPARSKWRRGLIPFSVSAAAALVHERGSAGGIRTAGSIVAVARLLIQMRHSAPSLTVRIFRTARKAGNVMRIPNVFAGSCVSVLHRCYRSTLYLRAQTLGFIVTVVLFLCTVRLRCSCSEARRILRCYIIDAALSPCVLEPYSEAVTTKSQPLGRFRRRKEREEETRVTQTVTARTSASQTASELAAQSHWLSPNSPVCSP